MSNATNLADAAPYLLVSGNDLVVKGLLRSSGGAYQGIVALADTSVTLNVTDMYWGLFTIAASTARTLTTPTAVAIVAALPDYKVGSSYDFTVLNTGLGEVTLAPGSGVTIQGGAKVATATSTWRVRIDSPTVVTIYAVSGRLDSTNVVLKNVASLLTSTSRPWFTDTQTITATGSFVFDPVTNGQVQLITVTGAATITLSAPTGIVKGAMYKIIFEAGDVLARSLVWNSAFKFPAATPIVTALSQTIGTWDSLTFTGGTGNTLRYEGSNLDVR